MAEEIPKYKSTLTGPELDEALRNIGKVQDAVQRTEVAAQTAEQYGQIVEQNQTAIQAIEDNLADVQGAAQNAADAKSAATSAAASASAASQSASDAEDAAKRAEAAAGVNPNDYYTKQQADAAFATAAQGQLAQSAVQSVNGQPGPNPELTPAIIGAAAPANVLPNVLVAGLPGIRSLAYQEVDLLSVDASDPTGEINTPMFFGSDTPGTQLTSTPYTSGPFYGFRQVLMSQNQSGTIHLVTVLLFETYPIAGRVWGNTYDMGAKTWYGWKQNGAQAATLAYDEMAAAYNEGVASVGQ